MWFDGIRQPDTLYVASVSRGKDSTAMLRAIQLMNWPLDMIVAVDVWATQDIPAELPPMVKFKDEWDQKCLNTFGMPVTRICAEREREYHTQTSSMTNSQSESISEISGDSRQDVIRGAENLKSNRLTYEDIFYTVMTNRKTRNLKPDTHTLRIPDARRQLVYQAQTADTKSDTTADIISTTESADFLRSEEHGATQISKSARSTIYGFPYTGNGGWCHRFKGQYLRKFFPLSP